MLDATFVAAVLEGIEGTLAELIERVEGCDLSEPLGALQDRTAAVRHSFENMAAIDGNGHVGETSTGLDADLERRSK